jgi:hypothetical protein
MIDPTKSPVPAWKRYAVIALLGLLLLVGGYMIYSKELKKPSSGSAAPPAATAAPNTPAGSVSTHAASTPSTTLALPVSSRNPFGS